MLKRLFSLAALLALAANLASAQGTGTTTTTDRKIASKVEPVYPELAKKMHIRGTVKIEAIVRPNGSVKSTRVLGGNPVLVEAATDAVNKWKFDTAQSESTEVVQLTFEAQ